MSTSLALFIVPKMMSPGHAERRPGAEQRLAPLEGGLGLALSARARLPRHHKPPPSAKGVRAWISLPVGLDLSATSPPARIRQRIQVWACRFRS